MYFRSHHETEHDCFAENLVECSAIGLCRDAPLQNLKEVKGGNFITTFLSFCVSIPDMTPFQVVNSVIVAG